MSVFDKHVPVKSRRVKHERQPEWLNDEKKHAIRNRDMHHKNKDWKQYKYWRNHTTHLIRKSKNSFFSNAIAENKDNAYIWKHIKSLGGQTTDSKLPKELTIDDTYFDNPLDIVEKINTYFFNISDSWKAAQNNDHNNKNKEDFEKLKTYIEMLLPSEVEFRIPFMKQHDVISNVQSLDTTKATGLDGMTPKILKTSAEIIGPNLLKIINISIKNGQFPDTLKVAKLFPIHKNGLKSDPSNYRPVSILPVVSKVIENTLQNIYFPTLISINYSISLSQVFAENIHAILLLLIWLIGG